MGQKSPAKLTERQSWNLRHSLQGRSHPSVNRASCVGTGDDSPVSTLLTCFLPVSGMAEDGVWHIRDSSCEEAGATEQHRLREFAQYSRNKGSGWLNRLVKSLGKLLNTLSLYLENKDNDICLGGRA